MSEGLDYFLNVANYVLTVIFTLEMILMMIAVGVKNYLRVPFNVFDAVIVFFSLLEITVFAESESGVSALRALRLLRVFKLAKNIKSLQILLNTVVESAEPSFYMTLLLLLYLFVFGVLGVQLLAGKMEDLDPPPLTPTTFDSLGWSIIAILQIQTSDVPAHQPPTRSHPDTLTAPTSAIYISLTHTYLHTLSLSLSL